MRSVKGGFAGHERRHWNGEKTDEAAYLWHLNWSGCSQDAPLHDTVALTLGETRRAWEQSQRRTAAGREEITTLGPTLLLGPCSSGLLLLTAVWRSCCSAWCHCAQRSTAGADLSYLGLCCWFGPFVLGWSSCLKADAVFMMRADFLPHSQAWPTKVSSGFSTRNSYFSRLCSGKSVEHFIIF